MKNIGKEVLFLEANKNIPRNGEGTFARLSDGRIIFAYTEYYGVDWADDAIAHICASFSSDEGETWSHPIVIVEKDPDAENIMSPSLFNIADGRLGMTYLRKFELPDGALTCMPMFISSCDNGKTWSAPVCCIERTGYYCPQNDCVTVTKEGRIILPFSSHRLYRRRGGTPGADEPRTPEIFIVVSDDNGNSFKHISTVKSPFDDVVGFAEPGVYVHEDGTYWMYCRTAYGFQYFSVSADEGKTWTTPMPQFCFTSPDAPMKVKKVGKYTVSVFNPIGYYCTRNAFEVWKSPKRTPLVCAVSRDDGRSFLPTPRAMANGALLDFEKNTYLLESDEGESYCYPAVIETKDGFLVSYYHSNGTGICLNSTKIQKVYFDELE